MGMFSSFFHPERGYEKGQEQLDKYYAQGQGYLNPYNQYGQSAYGDISEAMRNLMDPTALNAKWIANYTESPQAKQAEGLAQEHGLSAASGLGLMGSGTALDALQSGTSQIALNDRQNYLNDMMQKYMAGVGIGQNIFGTGANAAGQMGQNAMNMGQNSAQMAYGKENAPGSLFGNLLGLGAAGIGGYFGGRGQPNAWSTGGG